MVSWWLRDRPASTELSQNDTKGSVLSKKSCKVAEYMDHRKPKGIMNVHRKLY